MPASRPTSLTPIRGQRVEVEDFALARADELERGDAAAPARCRRPGRSARRGRRPRPSTIGCRGRDRVRGTRTCSPTAMVTGRPERWISSASWMPVAEAPTTRTPPAFELIGVAIVQRRQRGDPGRHRGGKRRNRRDVAGAAGDDHRAAPPVAAVGRNAVAVVAGADRGDGGERLDRRTRSRAR